MRCVGCGADLDAIDGPVHAYMTSSPACYQAFATMLTAEYSNPALMQTHRLTVDAFAVQHPGDPGDRRCVQSVGLHLARLLVQLSRPTPARDIDAAMQDFARHKHTLIGLPPPAQFRVTVSDVAPYAGGELHAEKVKHWAAMTWGDWSDHHDYIRRWVQQHSNLPL